LYYVTSHGFGHLNRAAAVIESLPSRVRVAGKTHPDQFASWPVSVRRPCELIAGAFDCGTVIPPGDSSGVDPAATFAEYERVHAAAVARMDDEIAFIRERGFAAVVSDVAPLPLRVARSAGVPAILIGNFTWHDIFSPHARRFGRRFERLIREMHDEYACADIYLRAQPAVESPPFTRTRDVGLVTRRGRSRRRELIESLGLRRDARLAYIYVGRYGQTDIAWQNLSRLDDFEFVSYHSIGLKLANWHAVDPGCWPPRDLAASVDVMVAKAGYGTVSDAMSHRTPLIFPPRHGFAEHRILAASLRRWGGGIGVSTREFKEMRVLSSLDRAIALRPAVAPWPTNGARCCVAEILRVAR